MSEFGLALDLLCNPDHHPMHQIWVAQFHAAVSPKEIDRLNYFQKLLGGYLKLDEFFFIDAYGYDPEGFGQDPLDFIRDAANRRPITLQNGQFHLSADSPPDPVAEKEWEALLSFLDFFWNAYVKAVISSRRETSQAALSKGRKLIARDGAVGFLTSLSERIKIGKENQNEIIIDKWLDLNLDLQKVNILRVGPTLFAFPHLVVGRNPENTLFEVSWDIPFSEKDIWVTGIDSIASIAFALADKSRLRILMMIAKESLTQMEIAQRMGYAKSTISRHMSLLLEAGLVQRLQTGDGRQVLQLNRILIEGYSSQLLNWFGLTS